MAIKRYSYLYLILLISVFSIANGNAQQTNFIHIQSEANQPYAVQLNGQMYSSNSTGYLVIPQIPLGEHTIVIGFAGNTYPEYSFLFTLTDKPRGFSLKQGVDNGWSLFDMVDFSVLRGKLAVKESVSKISDPANEKIKDSAIATSSVNSIEKKTNTTVGVVAGPSTGSDIPKATGIIAASVATTGAIVAKNKTAAKTTSIQKIFDKTSAGGIDQVYIVINQGKADTIALFIPILKEDTIKQGALNQSGPGKFLLNESTTVAYPMLFTKKNRLQIPSN